MESRPRPRPSDVVVVGGGVVGLSVALHLRWLGLSSTVLERDRIGDGTSTRGFGTVSTLGRWPESYLRLMIGAQDYYPAFADRLGSPDLYRVKGALTLVRDAEELAARRALMDAQQSVAEYVPGVLMDVAALREIEPMLGDVYPWGVYRAQDAQIEPGDLVRSLRAACVRDGVTIVEGARVDATSRVGGAWSIETPVGAFGAATLVNCAGVWAGSVGRLAGVEIPVRSVRGQIVVVEAGQPALGSPIGWSGFLDVRQATDGRVWAGTVQHVDSWDLRVRSDDTDTILGRMAEALPGMDGRRISEVWAGLRPVPADGLPLVGRVDGADDYYVAVTHGGLSFCGIDGRALAAQIAGGQADPIVAAFDPNRSMPGWQPSSVASSEAERVLQVRAGAHMMRTDATDWSRVATIASRSGQASRLIAAASVGRGLRGSAPDPSRDES